MRKNKLQNWKPGREEITKKDKLMKRYMRKKTPDKQKEKK